MAEAPDEALMAAYRGGDAGAFDTLYARHRTRLFRFVLRSIKARAVAEELYQEIWMRVIEARTTWTPKARFTTWLYTIAHNHLVDHWRKRGLTLVALEADDLPGTSPDPADEAQAGQSLERFAVALQALPALQREAFLLHEEGELSVAEIAAATGTNEEAAKSRLRYAMGKLMAAMNSLRYGGGKLNAAMNDASPALSEVLAALPARRPARAAGRARPKDPRGR